MRLVEMKVSGMEMPGQGVRWSGVGYFSIVW